MTLRLLLGDQLNPLHPWFRSPDPLVRYVLMEVRTEATYVRHHIQKIAAFFQAMRSFARWLEEHGHAVTYLPLDDEDNLQDIPANCVRLLKQFGCTHFEYQLPDEWRLDEQLRALAERLEADGIHTHSADTGHFLTTRQEVAGLFAGKKTWLMETFYRYMRKRLGILMEPDGQTPLENRWNFDAENRRKMPPDLHLPAHHTPVHQVQSICRMIRDAGIETIGDIDPERFTWPANRAESLALLRDFIEHKLPQFGVWQDAMTDRDDLLFHSRLSFSLNTKMISPIEVVRAAEDAWKANPDGIPLSSAEGFVRQIIGWREYMRGIYWAHMPHYASLNHFQHLEKLPDWYWTGHTRMRCLQHSIEQSLRTAYAHHIQRLMITGNFALLLGVHPDAVDQWYLGIYADAIEWVEITNTRGMSQYADGGIVATKPYTSSANYIHKMSNYCSSCSYQKDKKYGEGACPFNSLYWHFHHRHRHLLENNPRIGMVYKTWDRMQDDERQRILEQAEAYINTVDQC